jgi:hypothetical protein
MFCLLGFAAGQTIEPAFSLSNPEGSHPIANAANGVTFQSLGEKLQVRFCAT